MIDNPNVNNFYNDKEMISREDYIPTIKTHLLNHLESLIDKIKNEEPFPEGNITIDNLVDMDDIIENILNQWYY